MEEFVDLIAERAVLSIICNDPKKFLDVSDLLQKSDFSGSTNAMVYHSFEIAFTNDPDNIDKFTLRNTAIEVGYNNFDEVTNKGEYIEALFLQKVNKKNLAKCSRRVKDLSLKRKLLREVESAHEDIRTSEKDGKSAIELVSSVENKITGFINELDNRNEITILGEGFIDLANERADSPKDIVGLPTGLQRFDLAIGGGLRRGSVTLVGARPKNFKSGLALNIARNLSVEGIYHGIQVPTLLLDTELQKDYQMLRLGASMSEIPINLIETGKWSANKAMVQAVRGANERIMEAPLYHIYVGGFSIERILSTVRYWLTKYVGRGADGKFNDCLVIYDYIKLMDQRELGRDVKEHQVLGFHMTALHDFITRFDIPLLCMCQLNRDGSDSDDETVVAGADRLLWFASNFSILRRKKREEVETDGPEAGNMRLKTLMTRYGPGMDSDDYLNLKVNLPCMLAREGKLKSETKQAFQNAKVDDKSGEGKNEDENELASPTD